MSGVLGVGSVDRSGERGDPDAQQITGMSRVCNACGERKLWSEFHMDNRRGIPKTMCKLCRNRRRRDARSALVADPERGPAFLDRMRNHQQAYRDRVVKAQASGGSVPIGPFRAWIVAQIAAVAADHPEGPQAVIAARMGLPEGGRGARMMYRWLHTNDWIELDRVDAALCHAGEPGLLNELYPVDEQVAA